MLRAVPVAASPATPPPMTSTLAGGTRPAAVIWPVKKRPKWLAASITALQRGGRGCTGVGQLKSPWLYIPLRAKVGWGFRADSSERGVQAGSKVVVGCREDISQAAAARHDLSHQWCM